MFFGDHVQIPCELVFKSKPELFTGASQPGVTGTPSQQPEEHTVLALVRVPAMLFRTELGERLAHRIRRGDWLWPPWDTLAPGWKERAAEGYTNKTLLETQKWLGRKRTPRVHNPTCCWCETPLKAYQKCSVCLRARYCGSECQQRHWPIHRKDCAPPEPAIDAHVSMCVPDYDCFWHYLKWFEEQGKPGQVCGIMIMARQNFTKQFGQDGVRQTILRLAATGHPELDMLVAMGSKASGSETEVRESKHSAMIADAIVLMP